MKRELNKKLILYSISIILLLVLALLIFSYFSKKEKEISFERGCFYIWECQNITGEQSYICLRPDMAFNITRNSSCINLQKDNIILDCLGQELTSPGILGNTSAGIGIYATGVSNIEIKDCILKNWNVSGIKLDNVSNVTISETSAGNSQSGVIIINSSDILINNSMSTDDKFYNNNQDGISLTNTNRTKISGVLFEGNRRSGLYLKNSFESNISQLSRFESNLKGISINNSAGANSNNQFSSIYVNQNGIGFSIDSSFNTIYDSHITNNDLGLDIAKSNNTFYNNEFRNINNVDANRIAEGNIWNLAKTKKTNIMGGLFSGGNFWGDKFFRGFSDHPPLTGCSDSFFNGICEQEYTHIGNNNEDHAPLSSYTEQQFKDAGIGCNANISSCKGSADWTEGMTYCLNQSINITLTSEACFDIKEPGVTLNCKGNNIIQNQTNFKKAIKISSENVIIKNCGINGINDLSGAPYTETNVAPPEAYAILAENQPGLVLSWITIQNVSNSAAIKIKDSNNISLSNIYIKNTTHSGVYLSNSNGSLRDISVEGSQANGIYLNTFNSSQLNGFTVSITNSTTGIRIINSGNSSFANLMLYNNSNGLIMSNSNNNTISSSTFSNNNLGGILLSNSKKNIIRDITTNNNVNYSLNLTTTSDNNKLSNINIATTNGSGIYLSSSGNNTFSNIFTINNTQDGISLNTDSKFNNFTTITSKENDNGIFLKSSNNNTFSNVNSSNNKGLGVNLTDSSYNTFYIIAADNNWFGFSLVNSKNNKILNSTLSYNNITSGAGLYLEGSNSSYFDSLEILNNYYSLELVNSIYNNMSKIKVIDGMMGFYSSSENMLYDSYIEHNGINAIIIWNNSINNLFYNNKFININKENISVSTGLQNFWNTTYNGARVNIFGQEGYGGNYWKNATDTGYSQTCANNGKICNTQYNITSNGLNVDYLPIAKSIAYSGNCVNITSCGNTVWSSGWEYCLNNSITLNTATTCFNITQANITLNCQGYTIDGNYTGLTAINLSSSGSTTRNCIIQNFNQTEAAIIVKGSLSNLNNINLTNNALAIKIASSNNTISNINLNNNIRGLEMSGRGNSISRSSIINSSDIAISDSGLETTFTSLSISGTTHYDLFSIGGASIIDTPIRRYFVMGSLKIKQSNIGEVIFNVPINSDGILSDDIKINSNSIYINSSKNTLNSSVNLTFYGISQGGYRSISLNNNTCNSTTSPACILSTNINSPTISFSASSTGLFRIEGFYLTVDTPDERRYTTRKDNITFRFTVSVPAGKTISNCSLIVNEELIKEYTNEIANEETATMYNFTSRGIYNWTISCMDDLNQITNSSGVINATDATPTPDPTPTPTPTSTCASRSGTICSTTQVCTGTMDAARCCTGGTCNTPGSGGTTCAQNSGVICSEAQNCTGTIISASDTTRCCTSGSCIASNPGTASTEDSLMAKINKFFDNKNNLIITLVVIGIIILFIIILFFYAFSKKGNSEKINVYQDAQRPAFMPQYNPIQKPMQSVQIQAPPIQPKKDNEDRQKQASISAARLSLRNYILKELRKGVPESDVRDVLSKANWKDSEIDSALKDVNSFINKDKN